MNNIGKKISVFIGAAILIGNTSLVNCNVYAEKEIIEEFNTSTSEQLKSIIDLNSNIDEKYKDSIYDFSRYIDNNIYIDREELYDKFSSLEVESITNVSYAAQFDKQNNSIIIAEGFDDSITHELFHFSMSNKCNDYTSYLNEGMTLLLNNEYFPNRETQFVEYNDPRIITVKMLSEIITPEKMLESYTKCDQQIIKDELFKIVNNSKLADSLIRIMDEYCDIYASNNCDFGKTNKETIKQRNEIINILNIYYQKRFNKNITDDILMNEYANRLKNGYNYAKNNIVKCYFNNTINNNEPYIVYFKNKDSLGNYDMEVVYLNNIKEKIKKN